MIRPCAVFALSMLAVLSLGEDGPVLAQTTKPAAEEAKASTPPGPMVNDLGATLLVRMLLVAFHNAAVTGNYSVLRDLGTPQFRVANTPLNLAEATKNLRANNFRLDIASLATPVLLMRPHRDQQGRLRLYGFMPTNPEQVQFDLRYLYINKRWMIQGMRVNIGKVPPKIAEAVAKRTQMKRRNARAQAPASPGTGSAPSATNSEPAANVATSDLEVEADALIAFGQHLQSHGVFSNKSAPPLPERAMR